MNHLVPHFPSLFRSHHSKVGWPSYISTKLEHSPQEINHYIKTNIRTLWGQVVLCRKVRTNLSNLDQFNSAQETVSFFLTYQFNFFFFLFLLFRIIIIKNSQQCYQEPRMLYVTFFQFASSVPSWSKQHPGLHVEVDREC